MSSSVADFRAGIKRQVAEIKFLIHDLRVENCINNIIHAHVTLNTDLEIYQVEQAQAMHSDDLSELKRNTAEMRKALRDYSNAVTNYSPDKIIIAAGQKYIESIYETCELVLNPLWGRYDRAISFLPEDSRSVLYRNHYRNHVRWMCGVFYRIDYFMQESAQRDLTEEFDAGEDIAHYTNNVVYGYVVEKSRSRVEMQVDKSGPAVISGNKPRFRRMYFNLVMNAVDALQDKPVGMIKVRVFPEGDRVHIVVSDDGPGMYPEKVKQLLRARDTLDGELHSLGFVFVRQTVEEWGGDLSIDSTVDKGSTITIRLPYLPDREAPPTPPSKCQQYAVMPFEQRPDDQPRVAPDQPPSQQPPSNRATDPPGPGPTSEPADDDWDERDRERNCGRIIWRDYTRSQAQFPGCIFAIGVNHDSTIYTFAHQPYDARWNINHEDLNPMLYDATIRGRLEENEDKVPELILKEPHSTAAYFDLREIENGRSAESYIAAIHDEYILIARKLRDTGLAADLVTHITSAGKYFPGFEKTLGPEPFTLTAIAEEALSTE